MKPNVLILTIDSLRAHAVYGNKKSSITPNIDALIENGIYFTQAISTSDATGVSLGSLYTALYPFKTGISQYAHNTDVLTYFQIFSDSGYKTFATVPDISFFLKTIPKLNDKSVYVYDKRENWIQLVGGIGQQIIEKLEKGLQAPWLYYVHLMDLHAPFYLPKEFDSEKFGETRYDRMVSSIDFWIGKFLEKIDLTNTIVIISADHGDFVPIIDNWNNPASVNVMLKKGKKIPVLGSIGEKAFFALQSTKKKYKINKLKKNMTQKQIAALQGRATSYLYDELVRIPLIFAGYGIHSPKLISNQVKQIDIFPTLIDILQINGNSNDVDGKSLLPLFTSSTMDETPAYIETGQRNFKNTENPKLHGNVVGIRTPKYKYWRARDDPTKNVNLFDLQNDPDEENNIASANPSIVQMMEETLNNLRKKSVQRNQNKFSNEEHKAIEAELKKLGYM